MAAGELRVGVDVTPIISGSTGVARYSRALLAALQARGIRTRCFAIGRGAEAAGDGVRVLRVPLRVVHQTWRFVGWPRADRLAGSDVDLVHSLDLIPPPSAVPVVATVYDLGAVNHPELYPPRTSRVARHQLDRARRANVVLTDSGAVREELVARGFDGDRVVVAHGAAVPLPPAGALPGGLDRYLLAVGTQAPSKGFDLLLRAFAAARPDGLRLVFAGPPGFGVAALPELAASLGVADRVDFLGRVDDATLAALYEHALALCCASLVEGFGMPLLEAMRAGVPVIATSLPALTEVGADAVRWVQRGSVPSLADGIREIVEDDALRASLRARGHARAAQFSWERTADATISAYRLALASH